jgi:hypothetical protein
MRIRHSCDPATDIRRAKARGRADMKRVKKLLLFLVILPLAIAAACLTPAEASGS